MPHISPEDINRIADFESYRRDHGSYPESKSEATLIDHLNPRYLPFSGLSPVNATQLKQGVNGGCSRQWTFCLHPAKAGCE